MDRIYYINVFDELECTSFRFETSAEYHRKLYELTYDHRTDFEVSVKDKYTVTFIYQ